MSRAVLRLILRNAAWKRVILPVDENPDAFDRVSHVRVTRRATG
jgi:hypothetical protein